jgi:hypothetical protein
MTALQKVNLGTAPAGSDGDPVRAAFVKDNANVDVLNSQATLISFPTLITAPQALAAAHVGTRVGISLTAAGTVNLPALSTVSVDSAILIRNFGTTKVTLAPAIGTSDFIGVTTLLPGESVTLDVFFGSWQCLTRGRTNSDNETVNGNSTVVGNETVGGTLTVTGLSTITVPTRTAGDSSQNPASTAFVGTAVGAAVPGTLIGYTPSINAQSGGYGAGVSTLGSYYKVGRLVFVQITLTIPSAGSAATPLIGLPFPAVGNGVSQDICGRENNVTGKMIHGLIASGGSVVSMINADNSNPVVSGASISMSGCYVT